MISRRNSLKCLISCEGFTMKTLPFLLSMENIFCWALTSLAVFQNLVIDVHFSREILAWFTPLLV